MNPDLMSWMLIVAIGVFALSMSYRMAPLFMLQPEMRWDHPYTRIVSVVRYAIGQYRFFQPFELLHGLIHVLIFWGFLAVSINTIQLVGRGFVADWYFPGLDGTLAGLIYTFVKDVFILAVMIGTMVLLMRRLIVKPERMTLSMEANVILIWIFFMMFLDILYSSTFFIMFPDSFERKTAFIGALGMKLLTGIGLGKQSAATSILNTVGFWGHVALVLSFLNYLPYGKHFHVVLSLPGIFFSPLKHKASLSKLKLESGDEVFGVGRVVDFSWKRAIDMYNCTECGRCQVNCPAHLSEKPLSPKSLIMAERDHFKRNTPSVIRAAWHTLMKGKQKAQAKFDRIDMMTGRIIKEDALWACTSCGSCTENCPVLIEHVPNIVDMRRFLVQMESSFPTELTAIFDGWENMSNPWFFAPGFRGGWLEEFGVKTPAENSEFEYLYYVGCAGSFDDRNKEASMALVRLMQKGNVNFVCMGNDEMCCGETARRLGNEYLAQNMIQANIESFHNVGVKKIITSCPHCYNTLKNEYREFGADYEVISHTELIKELIDEGRLTPDLTMDYNGPVVYHDSCYLGRYNDIYDAPRKIAASVPGVWLVEPTRRKTASFCCGAGGGRMWMEENTGSRINRMRCEQLLETGAKTFATACPYCQTMLDDAIKEKGLGDEIKVLDLAEIVKGAVNV